MVESLLVLVVCLLLLSFLLWKEWRRQNKAWLSVRVVCSVLAVTGLACLALPISITKKQTVDRKAVVLLTAGYNSDTLQQVLKQENIDKVYTIDKNVKAANAVYLPDAALIKAQGLSVHVLGYGLGNEELTALGNGGICFHPSVIENDFLHISWQQKLPSGEPLLVQGRFANTSSTPVKLVLSGLGANLDSVSIAANQTATFQLHTIPAHLDKAVYALTALSDDDTLRSEPLPVEVHTTQPLRILVLAASPDFENKFLRNWLAEKGFPFVMKTTISTNKYDKEYNNMASVPIDRISPALLDGFDLVVADMTVVAKLPPAAIATIRSNIENKGMGLVVKADSLVHSPAFYAAPFPLVEKVDSVQHAVRLRFAEEGSVSSPLKIEQPVYIKNRPGTQPLIYDQQLRIVASTALSGMGKVIITTIPNTYMWQLSGNRNDYTTYWTTLLTGASRKTVVTNQWTVAPVLPSIHEEVRLTLQTSTQTIPRIQVGESAVYMEQDPRLPSQWTGKYWPKKRGWLPVLSSDGTSDWWYVYEQKDWSGVKAAEKMAMTKRYASANRQQARQPSATAKDVQADVPKIYFLVVFLACCGVLWLEKRLHQQ